MLRPSVSLAVWLQMYVEAHTGVAPDIGWGSLARLHNVSWLRCRLQDQRKTKSVIILI